MFQELSLLAQLSWNSYAVISFAAAAVTAGLGWYLLLWFRRGTGNIFFILMVWCLSVWAFGEGMQRLSAPKDAAFFWAHAAALGWIFMMPFFVHFVLFYTRREHIATHPAVFAALYVPALVFYFAALQTPLLLDPDTFMMKPWGWQGALTPFEAVVFVPWLWALGIIGFFVFFQELRRRGATKTEKKVVVVVLAGLAAPYLFGTVTQVVLPLAGIDIVPLSAATMLVLAGAMFLQVSRWRIFSSSLLVGRASVVNAMADGVVAASAAGSIQFANRAAVSLGGASERGLIGSDLSSLFEKDGIRYQHFVSDVLAPAKSGNKVSDYESEIIGEGKVPIPVLISAAPILFRETDKEPAGIVLVIHDNRKTMELLHETEARNEELRTVQERLEARLKEVSASGKEEAQP